MFEPEVGRHEAKAHGYAGDKEGVATPYRQHHNNHHHQQQQQQQLLLQLPASPPLSKTSSTESLDVGGGGGGHRRKTTPRPIPNLIPIGATPPSSGEKVGVATPTILKIPQIRKRTWDERDDADAAADVEDDDEPLTTSPILEAVGLLAKTSVATSLQQPPAQQQQQQQTNMKNGHHVASKKKAFSMHQVGPVPYLQRFLSIPNNRRCRYQSITSFAILAFNVVFFYYNNEMLCESDCL